MYIFFQYSSYFKARLNPNTVDQIIMTEKIFILFCWLSFLLTFSIALADNIFFVQKVNYLYKIYTKLRFLIVFENGPSFWVWKLYNDWARNSGGCASERSSKNPKIGELTQKTRFMGVTMAAMVVGGVSPWPWCPR